MYAITFPVNHGNSDKNRLLSPENAGYSFRVAAKSATGRGNPSNLLAISDAPSVFFCIVAFVHPFFTAQIRIESMVAQAGQPSGWPVSSEAGISTPVWATTNHERGNSGGSSLTTHWRLTPCHLPLPKLTLNLSFYSWLCAVQILMPYHTVKAWWPPMNSAPVVYWRVIMSLPLPGVCRLQEVAMFNDTPLELDEALDQCRALAYALIELDQPEAREILIFILAERLNLLYRLNESPEPDNPEDACE
ncbi:ash family protein [Dickeya fangzhongdai]|uniref:ash family protein n=1 Tax=Dickeya fangzhongdai TaxID=1778540 RepID=UPI003D7DCC83